MGDPGLKVLMTADAVGGVWTYALDLAGGLSDRGVRTTLAVLGPAPTVEQRALAARIPGLAVVETGFALDWTATGPEEVEAAARGVAELSDAVQADIVHLNSPALAGAAPFSRPVLAFCHSCVLTWWQALRTGPLPPYLAWRTEFVRAGYTAAAALAAPSAAFADATSAAYGLARAPSVVRNGRRAPAVGPTPPDEEVFVLTVGRLWDDAKNVAALDRAAARLAMPVLAAGPLDGPNGAAIRLAHARPLGRLDDAALAAHLARRPVFCSPALYEPFGLAVLEAAQAGCALVLSDIATFRELWEGAAEFVPAGDEEALADALARLTSDRDRRRALGDAARARALRYGIDAMAAGTLGLYRSLIARRRVAA